MIDNRDANIFFLHKINRKSILISSKEQELVITYFVLHWLNSAIYLFCHSVLPYFSLDVSYISTNHDSKCLTPKYVHEKLQKFQTIAEPKSMIPQLMAKSK
jgi:hypothetical protein